MRVRCESEGEVRIGLKVTYENGEVRVMVRYEKDGERWCGARVMVTCVSDGEV